MWYVFLAIVVNSGAVGSGLPAAVSAAVTIAPSPVLSRYWRR